jgi:1,4-alpha-glucan branching enzyme
MANQPDLQTVPMGASVSADGVAFRVWAPRGSEVHVIGGFNGWQRGSRSRLTPVGGGHWATFVPGARAGQEYLFWIAGPGSQGPKRDPRARELTFTPAFPAANCVIVDPKEFPWHHPGYQTPAFSDLILYQLHVGTFSISEGNFGGKFVDVVERLPHLEGLGVNGLQLLPIVEFPTEFSLGYNGTDYFSPENDYAEDSDLQLQGYLVLLNRLLEAKRQPPYANLDQLRGSANQLRALVDVCHVYGMAVLLDVVYNHAGGGFDEQSLYFFDRMPKGNHNDSLYFTDQGWAGGLAFAYWNHDVKQFLIDNATFFYQEYRIDGYRFDEVSVMDRFGGWQTAQFITDTCRFINPKAILIAEYWPVNPQVTQPTAAGGAGFDATWQDSLREALRDALSQSSAGATAALNLDRVAEAIGSTNLQSHWRAVNCIENHDIVKAGAGPRIPKLADGSDPRSWYARSRSRVASGLLLTSAGIPMLFMGQEFLEDQQWSDDPGRRLMPDWSRLVAGDQAAADHLRFTTDLVWARRRQPALRGESVRVFHVHSANRVLAYHRWIEGVGQDVVVVASLNESPFTGYRLGFPGAGRWEEIFNSDFYDPFPNPNVAGNGGWVGASGGPLDGMPTSAAITIPPNGILLFARGR